MHVGRPSCAERPSYAAFVAAIIRARNYAARFGKSEVFHQWYFHFCASLLPFINQTFCHCFKLSHCRGRENESVSLAFDVSSHVVQFCDSAMQGNQEFQEWRTELYPSPGPDIKEEDVAAETMETGPSFRSNFSYLKSSLVRTDAFLVSKTNTEDVITTAEM